jgi:hypothetical protein
MNQSSGDTAKKWLGICKIRKIFNDKKMTDRKLQLLFKKKKHNKANLASFWQPAGYGC